MMPEWLQWVFFLLLFGWFPALIVYATCINPHGPDWGGTL